MPQSGQATVRSSQYQPMAHRSQAIIRSISRRLVFRQRGNWREVYTKYSLLNDMLNCFTGLFTYQV